MDRRSHASALSIASVAAAAVILVAGSSGVPTADAYAFCPSSSQRISAGKASYPSASIKTPSRMGIRKRREDGSDVTLYLFPSQPTVSAANANIRRPRSGSESETSLPAMSNSIMAESDVLPPFSMAHGILSPEVVTRIADTNDLEEGEPLHRFLKTYKRRGPMACLPMLSDPCILPELTRAMREIA